MLYDAVCKKTLQDIVLHQTWGNKSHCVPLSIKSGPLVDTVEFENAKAILVCFRPALVDHVGCFRLQTEAECDTCNSMVRSARVRRNPPEPGQREVSKSGEAMTQRFLQWAWNITGGRCAHAVWPNCLKRKWNEVEHLGCLTDVTWLTPGLMLPLACCRHQKLVW